MKKALIIGILAILALAGCRKEELGWKLPRVRALVKTEFASGIQSTGFTAHGSVDAAKAGEIKERGFCWSENDNPSIENNKIIVGSGTGEFKTDITGLLPDKIYYIRAYAINPSGVWYGEVRKQQTFPGYWPKVELDSVSEQGAGNVRMYGRVTDDGGYPSTIRGFCYSTNQIPKPDTSDFKIYCGTGQGAYDTIVSGLSAGDWYVVAFAINGQGISYSSSSTKITVSSPGPGPTVPTVVTSPSVTVGSISASVSGSVSSDGGSPITALGFCYSTNPNPDIITGQVESVTIITFNFSTFLAPLNSGTTYYIRAYATNAVGTGYGNEIVITTDP